MHRKISRILAETVLVLGCLNFTQALHAQIE
jgi:hypothetical protein